MIPTRSFLPRRAAVVPAIAFLCVAAGAPRALASVLVVAPSGAGFTQIQAAVSAAVDGDVVLVKPGTYSGFTITNKALDVVADPGGSVHVNGRVLVNQLAATRTVTLTGLHVVGGLGQPALQLSFDQGAVRVQNCTIEAGDQPCGELRYGDAALDVDVCASVVLTRCTLSGGDGGDIPSTMGYGGGGGYGTTPTQSQLAFYECTFLGGAGGGVDPAVCGATLGYGYAGGSAGRFLGCPVVFGSRCTFIGGAGGFGGSASLSGLAGNGVEVLGASPYGDTHAWWLETTYHAGTPACAGCGPGMSEVVVPQPSTTSTALAGSARLMQLRSIAREGELVRLRFEGNPGDRVELFVADAPRFAFATGWRGVLSVRSRGTPVMQAGTIPPSGVLEIPWTIGDLGPGASSKRLLMQPSFVDSSGQATLGTPHTLVLLDAAF